MLITMEKNIGTIIKKYSNAPKAVEWETFEGSEVQTCRKIKELVFHFVRSEDETTTSLKKKRKKKKKAFLFLQIFPTHSSKLSVKQENRKEIIENLQRMRTSHSDKIVMWR